MRLFTNKLRKMCLVPKEKLPNIQVVSGLHKAKTRPEQSKELIIYTNVIRNSTITQE